MTFLEHPLPGLEFKEPPLVSVVVPAYNKAPYLKEAVDSIVTQTYQKTEIIIVNDESTDDTIAVVQDIIRTNPGRSIQLIDKKNGGVSDSRNHGIARARGDYVLPLDGDDKAAPTYISTALDAFQKTGANLFSCNVEIFGRHPGEWKPRGYDKFGIRYDNCVPTLSMYDRRFWSMTGGYKVAMGFVEDWEFWINCSRFGVLQAKSEEKLFLYRSHDSGLASAHIHNGYPECLTMVVLQNPDLYSVEQVLQAHSMLLVMRQCSIDQAVKLRTQHPNEWFLKFWKALLDEAEGNFQSALEGYSDAVNASSLENWQPIFRLGMLLLMWGKAKESEHLFHIVKTQRPDMSRIVAKLLRLRDTGELRMEHELGRLLYNLPPDELECYRQTQEKPAQG